MQQSSVHIPDHLVHGAQSFVDAQQSLGQESDWKHVASGTSIEGEHSREPASPSGIQIAAP